MAISDLLDLLGRLLPDRLAALIARRLADARHQQPQIIVDLRHGRHRAARIRIGRPLVDADCRLQALDQIDVRPLHLVQELPRVDGQALDVLPLTFGVQRIERQAALSGTAGTGDHHHLVARDIDIHVFQIVHPRPANADRRRAEGRVFGILRRGRG
jgi:acetoacetate decarboxylase